MHGMIVFPMESYGVLRRRVISISESGLAIDKKGYLVTIFRFLFFSCYFYRGHRLFVMPRMQVVLAIPAWPILVTGSKRGRKGLGLLLLLVLLLLLLLLFPTDCRQKRDQICGAMGK